MQDKRSATFAIIDYLSFLCQAHIKLIKADTRMVKGWPGQRVEWLFQESPKAPRGVIRWAWHKFQRKYMELHKVESTSPGQYWWRKSHHVFS